MWRRTLTHMTLAMVVLTGACGVPLEAEHQERAVGEFESWDWILAGELKETEDEVCIELVASPGRGSVHGGPICHAVPAPDDGNVRAGTSASGDKELGNIRAVVGENVEDVRFPTGYDINGERVFVKESASNLGWLLYLYDPREIDRPTHLYLLDATGSELTQLDVPGTR